MLGKPSKRDRKKLEELGTRAPATVVDIASKGMAVTVGADTVVGNTELLLKTTLRVEPNGQPSFEITKRIRWPQLSVPSTGQTVNVIFDPDDHEEVMVDFDTPVGNLATAMPDLNKLMGVIKEAR